MRIIVCIKQVPEVADLRFDPQFKTLIREGVPNVVNPFDRRALAEAIRLRDLVGGEVVVLTMGPPQARQALIECLAAGADRGVHLLGREFAGADTLATARALAMALKREQFDLIFCGKYSVDAETGQVGPELAELLDIPQLTGATRLQLSEDRKTLTVDCETDEGFETLECGLPVLLTAAERLIKPIKVKEPQIEEARAKPIKEVSPVELSSDTRIFGLSGSPTWVTEIRSLARERQVEMMEGDTADEKVARLIERLDARGALIGSAQTLQVVIAPPNLAGPATGGEIWAVGELAEGQLRRVSFELLGKGIELARKLNGTLAAFVAGPGSGTHASMLAAHGADKVYFADDPALERYSTAAYAALLVQAISAYNPLVVMLPSTSRGRDLAPRVAARLAVGLTADCIDLDLDQQLRLVQHKPAFGGNIVALILTRTLPQMATVKPGMLRAVAPNLSRTATVTCLAMPKQVDNRVRLIESRREVSVEAAELEEAETVICVGTGIGGPDSMPLIEELARSLDARVGATRRVVDQGWLPRHLQIGLTGKVVSPRLYLGIGVRGALNHTIGIQQARTIVAINVDPAADIFRTADLGVVGDFAEVVSALTRRLPRREQR